MAWEDRVKDAAYVSPSGTRFVFDYENVSRSGAKRTASFDFIGVDGTYVQDNGKSGRKYPMRCYFHGDEHDLEASSFEEALFERGRGRLEHPLYGTIDVVPFGEISRRDDLVTAANQSVVEVTFWHTLKDLYPQPRVSRSSDLETSVSVFSAQAAAQFEANVDLDSSISQSNMQVSVVESVLRPVQNMFSEVANATASVRRSMQDQIDAIQLSIVVLVGEPLSLAQQIVNLVQTPVSASAGIRSILNAYTDFAEFIMQSAIGTPQKVINAGVTLPSVIAPVVNNFFLADLVVTSVVSAAGKVVLENDFKTKPEAIAAADQVMSFYDSVVSWRDEAYAVIPSVFNATLDTGESHQAMQQLVAFSVAYLIDVSFSLVPERVIVLDRPRSIIELAAELYGEVDGKLDFLISSNDLSGSEIIELPAGTLIRYYA